jgi:hypothetical protein
LPCCRCRHCFRQRRKYNAKDCKHHFGQVTQFVAWVPIYTDAGKKAREAAAQGQKGGFVSNPQWQRGWVKMQLGKCNAKYRELAGESFWVNLNDLAWFEEISRAKKGKKGEEGEEVREEEEEEGEGEEGQEGEGEEGGVPAAAQAGDTTELA